MLSKKMTTFTIPVALRQRIKILSAMEGVSMIDFVDGMVQKKEQARGVLPRTIPGTTPVKEATKCQP
jgi:hypothetical protein